MNEARKKRKRLRNKKRKLLKKVLSKENASNNKSQLHFKKLLERFDDSICKFNIKKPNLGEKITHTNDKGKKKLKNGHSQISNGDTPCGSAPKKKKMIHSKDSTQNSNRNLSPNKRRNLVPHRRSLPLFEFREGLLAELTTYDSVIVMGDTGSGKTTQIPQYLHEDGLNKDGLICITQPRRVAAISIAKRVAEEMNTEIGGVVGYSVRFEESISHNTKIKFVTDGMLLRESILDPLLLKYRWIILDEAHERSLNTDILFGIVKSALKTRKQMKKIPLHIVIMSATMDVNHMASYFNIGSIVTIPGRQHPIALYHAIEQHDDYALACMSTVFQIHREAPPQDDIIIFLTGQEEIDSVANIIRKTAKDSSLAGLPTLNVYPFYAALPSHKENFIFQPSKIGERKVIVSTNVAETSITIPGIKYVIDSGRVKVRTFNANSGFEVLEICKISKAQAHQRYGRAGRESPGVCYRAYTLEEYNSLPDNTVPDVLRANLSNVILQLLAVGIKSIANFDFIDKPSAENLKEAESCLRNLDAITQKNNNYSLTNLGRKMACFPLDPRYSRILISATEFGCTEEVASIIAVLSSESVFVKPTNKKEEVAEIREKYFSPEGDHISLLKIYRAFKSSKDKKEWCRSHFLNQRNLSYAIKVKKQLVQLCHKNDIPMKSCGNATEPILRSFITGLYTNVAELQLNGKYASLHSREEVALHPSSTLFGSKPPYILYTELVKTGKKYMHFNSSVDAQLLVDFNPEYFRSRHLKKS